MLAAGRGPSPESDGALEELCTAYWYPLYAYVRRRGHDPDEARDLTQAFFARLLEKKTLGAADPSRGRFRTFLLSSLKNFLASEWRRATALKRGGGSEPLPLDFESAEQRYRIEPSRELSPETLYERRWALRLLDDALEGLHEEYRASGRGELFEALRGVVGGGGETPEYRELAAALGRSEESLRKAASRLRHRFRARLRASIVETVGDEGQVDDEIRHLLRAVATPGEPRGGVTEPVPKA